MGGILLLLVGEGCLIAMMPVGNVEGLIGEEVADPGDGLEALSRVDAGEYQLAILLNPTPISSVLAVADQGVRMPQKSTYFHPKTPAGLVINPL